MLAIGRVVPLDVPLRPDFVRGVETVYEHLSTVAEWPRELTDERLPPQASRAVVLRELVAFLKWVAHRMRAPLRTRVVFSHRRESVLCLLPRSAPAQHVFRRALPFAALGLRVTCVFPVDVAERYRAIVKWFAKHFSCGKELRVWSGAPTQALVKLADALLVLTGSRATADRVRANWKGEMVGATGRCAVMIGMREGTVRRLHAEFQGQRVAQSCTNVRASFILDRTVAARPSYSGLSARRWDQNKFQVSLRQLHPSVVLALPGSIAALPLDADRRLEGYQCLPCDAKGRVSGVAGFGADPVWHWPGDYLI
jgi:hypothetical protein